MHLSNHIKYIRAYIPQMSLWAGVYAHRLKLVFHPEWKFLKPQMGILTFWIQICFHHLKLFFPSCLGALKWLICLRLPAEYLLTVFLFMDTNSNLVNIFPEKSVDHSDRLKKHTFVMCMFKNFYS